MSLLMQALRRAESAKKAQAGGAETQAPAAPAPADAASAPEPSAPPPAPVPRAGPELTLEMKEPTADELAAASAQVIAAQEREAGGGEQCDAASEDDGRTHAFDSAPPHAAATTPVDYFSGGEPPPRPVYVAPVAPAASAPQGFDPERGAPATPSEPVRAPEPVQEIPAAPAPTARVRPNAAQDQAAAQAALREAEARSAAGALFAAKKNIANRRPLIFAGLGIVLLATAAGVFYYQFLQVAPPSNFPAQGQVAVLVPAAPEPAPVVAPVIVPVPVPAATALPVPAPAPTPVPARATLAPRAAAPVRAAPRPAETAELPAPAPASPRVRVVTLPSDRALAAPIEVRRNDGARAVSPALAGAYQAFQSGDVGAARSQYQRVLQQEPDNRDALLGMAAIALRRGQAEEAGSFYARLIELNPSDAEAIAGMASVQSGDPGQAESRLKGVLAASPDTGAALYALGNLYAQQARWPEAQQSYFRAFGSTPTNAAYAFNLAVSLDKLDQKKLALDYYRRALQLSPEGASGSDVDRATVSARIRQLEQDGKR